MERGREGALGERAGQESRDVDGFYRASFPFVPSLLSPLLTERAKLMLDVFFGHSLHRR